MIVLRQICAILLGLSILLGSVAQAVARTEMAGMQDLVLCGADGSVTVTLDATGKPVQRHACTHCLAAQALAVMPDTAWIGAPIHLAASVHVASLVVAVAAQPALAPSARGPPSLV